MSDGGESGHELGYLFVMTYGRSGSTLVAGLLNAIPGYLVRGEHRDALRPLFEFQRSLLATREEMVARYGVGRLRSRTHPFFGIADVHPARTTRAVRHLALETVLRPKADTRVVGFKEIRWYAPDVEEYVAWLREVFPGARFVVNTRDHAAVLRSGWWAQGDPDEQAARLAQVESRMLAAADGLGDAAYHLHFEEYVADPSRLRGLYDWLGEPWDEESVRATMSRRHSV